MTSNEALGFAHQARELPLQDRRPNLLSLLLTHSRLLPSLKPQQQKCTIYAIYEKRRGPQGGVGTCKNSHSFFQQNLKPLCTRIIAFTVLFAVIQKRKRKENENSHIKKLKRKTETAYLKITTTVQYIIILLDICFT